MTEMSNGVMTVSAVNQNGKRELSPNRAGPPNKTIKSAHGEDVKPTIPRPSSTATAASTPAPFGSPGKDKKGGLLPMGRGQGFDMRAEDEAARRDRRSAVGNIKFAGASSRARQTDLFGEQALRARLEEIGKDHNVTIDDEAMRYFALAAEIRVRTLLTASIRAQQHRVNSSHQHKPPMSKAHGGKPPQALWSQKITSDPHAVMAALANANREENKVHRVARTERKARETELARAAAIQREREEQRSSPPPPETAPSSGGPASESDAAGGSSTPKPPREPVFQSAPTFGAPIPKKSGKGKKAANRDMSADALVKITNTTAALQAGGRKRYAWEMGAMSGAFRPQVPSLLSGKRKKGVADDEEKEKEKEAEAVKDAEKDAEKEETPKPPKRPKRTITGPHRRHVDIEAVGDKKARDDVALTVVDVLFALEHEGSGRGPGTTEDITRRFWTRPGGPYGKW